MGRTAIPLRLRARRTEPVRVYPRRSERLTDVDPHFRRAVIEPDRVALVADVQDLRPQRPGLDELPDQAAAKLVQVVIAAKDEGLVERVGMIVDPVGVEGVVLPPGEDESI